VQPPIVFNSFTSYSIYTWHFDANKQRKDEITVRRRSKMAEGQRVDIPRVKLGTQGLEVVILGECDHFYRKNHPELRVCLFSLILAGCDVFKNIFTGLIGLKAGFWMYGA
jgi:hypothetical protein